MLLSLQGEVTECEAEATSRRAGEEKEGDGR